MKKKILFISFIIIFFLLTVFIVNNFLIGNTKGYAQNIKYLVPNSVRKILRETVFAYKYLNIENAKLKNIIKNNFINQTIKVNKKLPLIDTKKIKSESGENTFVLSRYKLPYPSQVDWGGKPVSYLAKFNNFVFLISGSGEITYVNQNELSKKIFTLKKNISKKKEKVAYISGYGKEVFQKNKILNINNIKFSSIESNFSSFIDTDAYIKKGIAGPRDIEIIDNEIYISFVDIKSCEKVSIIKAKINFEYLNFENFFSWKDCSKKSFSDQRSGGRIKNYDKNNVIFTIGDYSKLYYPAESQNPNSLFGKIIKINKETKKYNILSIGHRNPQGLYFDQKKNFLFSTDHGPDGGDEVNVQNLKFNKVENFGWPISSYGTHYSSTIKNAKNNNMMSMLNKGAPLHKSHKKFNFTEPLKHFSPKSIGISEIIKIPESFGSQFKNDFFVSAMGNVILEGDQTLHHLRFDESNKKIIFEDKVVINERIRDIIYNKEQNLFLMTLETEPSLGVLKIISD